jgi:hypothetical protein
MFALFVLLYGMAAPWWRSLAGRNIMAVMGTVAVAFGYFAWVIFQGGVPGYFFPVRFFLFLGIFLSIGWRVLILVRRQIFDVLRERKLRHELEDQR